MLARIQFMMARTGMCRNPDAKLLGLEQLSDVTPGISVMVEALNHAHVLPTAEWTQASHHKFSPAAVTRQSEVNAPEGFYSAQLAFVPVKDGFSVVIKGDGERAPGERFFTVTVNDKGGFDFRTHRDFSGEIVRKETLPQAEMVVTYFGEWMKRNFTGGTLRNAESWLPKVLEGRAMEARHPTSAGKPAHGTLTA